MNLGQSWEDVVADTANKSGLVWGTNKKMPEPQSRIPAFCF